MVTADEGDFNNTSMEKAMKHGMVRWSSKVLAALFTVPVSMTLASSNPEPAQCFDEVFADGARICFLFEINKPRMHRYMLTQVPGSL